MGNLICTHKKSSNRAETLRAELIQSFWTKRQGTAKYLVNVNIPAALIPQFQKSADSEGFVLCDIGLKDGMIESVVEASSSPGSSRRIDCRGSILLTCFSDSHTHLVKTEIVPRLRNNTGTINEALRLEANDEPNWEKNSDVKRRMEFAAQCAVHHGTRAIRTHMDGAFSENPGVRDAVYAAFEQVRKKYDDVLIIQGVANIYLPLWLDTDKARAHALRAKEHDGVVLGAYCSRNETGDQPDPDLVKPLDALFGFASELEMDVDMHIDETNDPGSCALASLVESLGKARKSGYLGKVVLGHCCALSLQKPETQLRICKSLAELGAYVVTNPFTNMGLQDRQGTGPPFGATIPYPVARTPQWRGLTLIQELREAGVTVASASDNVRDHWYPYGDYDLLQVMAQVQAMGHLDTAPCEGAWFDLVTTAASEAMGIDFSLSPGKIADLILFPSARKASELFARPQTDRIVLRKGSVLHSSLPDFSELDDLVSKKTVPLEGVGYLHG